MAMISIVAASIGLFLLVIRFAGVVSIAGLAIDTTRSAVQAMRDPALDELARERTVRAAAIRLVIASGSLILRSLLALAAALFPVVAADWVGIVPLAQTFAFMERWYVIVIATVVVALGYVVGFRVWSR